MKVEPYLVTSHLDERQCFAITLLLPDEWMKVTRRWRTGVAWWLLRIAWRIWRKQLLIGGKRAEDSYL